MTDYFALLGQPRRPWLDPEALKDRFHQLAAEHHPDVAGENDKFTDLNTAYQILREPASRLRHLLELENTVGAVDPTQFPSGLTERFMKVATLEREIHVFLRQQSEATTAIQKSVLAAELFAMQRDVGKLIAELEVDRARLTLLLQAEDRLWDQRTVETGYRLATLQQEFAFVRKWIDQMRERLVQIEAQS